MDRNLGAILLALLLSAFVEGLFSFVTPFYLTSQGISLLNIGIVFSIASLALVLLRILLGAYTDIRGRKFVFAFSFLLQAISSGLFNFVRSLLDTSAVQVLHDLGLSVRTSLKSTIIFENARRTYQKMIAWVAGIEHLMMAFVNFAAAGILLTFAYGGSYVLMAILQFISFAIITVAYTEKGKVLRSKKISLRDMYSSSLSRNMYVIMLATALFSTGIRLSHGFAEPLYFQAKYSLSKTEIGLIIGLHRLSLALPLFVTGKIMHRFDVKKAYVFSTLVTSLFLLSMGLINNIFIAVPLWLIHDVVGGSIQIPAAQMLTQQNAHDDERGKDVNTMELLAGLVSIVTPSLTGALITFYWDSIFILGGFLILLGSLILHVFYK